MSRATNTILRAAGVAGILILPSGAHASTPPSGVWLDHTGRGAVEISDCGASLCGRLVWLKDEKDSKGCGLQIIGGAKPLGRGTWGNGWIYDPDDDAKYSVELTPQGADKLRVVGYLGSKLFSETMVWTRAPSDLKRCTGQDALATAPLPSDERMAQPEAKSPAVAAPEQAGTDKDNGASASPDTASGATSGAAPPRGDRTASVPKPAKRKQGCKVEFASIVVSFPCP